MTTSPTPDVEVPRALAATLDAPAAWRATGRRGRSDLLAGLIGDAPQIAERDNFIGRWPAWVRMGILVGLCIAGWAVMIALGLALSHV